MMFPKPEKRIKEPRILGQKKPKKELPEWKQNLFSHHQPKESRADRAEFPPSVVKEVIAEAGGRCQCGCGLPDTETHHVQPRARDGRGVRTNAMRLNGSCNTRFHDNEAELQKWIEIYRKRYGEYFWYDEQDWQEHERKQNKERDAERDLKDRYERLEPITNLLTLATGRSVKAKEMRLLDSLNQGEMVAFVGLINDVINANSNPVFNERFED